MKNLNFKRLMDSRRVSDMSRMAYSTNFLQTPEVMALIDDFMLKRTDVRNGNYTLNPQTGRIDVTGNITVSFKGVERLPKYINFGVINGDFTADIVNKLVSSFGFPTRVEGNFTVNGSHQPPLHNTDFFPDYVGGMVRIHNLPDIGDIDINTIASGVEPIIDNEFLKQNNMKRIKDSTIPDKWFMNGKAPLLNKPDSQNDTLWKVVLWSGAGYAADPYLFYAPKDFSEWQFEVLVAALEKNGITDYFVDDYYFNNPDIDTSEDAEVDVYDLMDENGDIDIDASVEGGGVHVLRGENLKIEPADEPIEYYTGENVSDSRRVRDGRFEDIANDIENMTDIGGDVFYPYEQKNPENTEWLRSNKDRFQKHFSGRGISATEREMGGKNGLHFSRMKDSARRVKDSEDDEFEFVVAVVGSESMSLEEGEQYEDELVKLLSYKRFSDGDRYCELNEVEIMDRDSSGDTSVAVWGDCFADSDSTVRKALKQWTANLGYDVRISTSGAIY